jgi:predicted lipoprotein with Yx(FWY)xxD motif
MGKPTAGPGVTASKLGTTKRSDGATEVTYNGHPLYTYAGDSAPGQTSGQGLDDYGAEWYALSGRGDKVDNG